MPEHPYRPLPEVPAALPKRPWYLVLPGLLGWFPWYRRAYGGEWMLVHTELPRVPSARVASERLKG